MQEYATKMKVLQLGFATGYVYKTGPQDELIMQNLPLMFDFCCTIFQLIRFLNPIGM